MLGEGLLPTLREVLASGTASKDAIVIPRGAYVEAALFEDASLAVWKSTSASGAYGVEVDAMIQHERAVKF